MDEDEYKSTYNELASVRCIFEKALVNHQAKCSLSRHFCLADREGYSCDDAESSEICRKILTKLRKNSLFALKLREVSGPLPHNMEIRVQAGGMAGVAKTLDLNDGEQSEQSLLVDDIHSIIGGAIEKYGALDQLPYSVIIQSVVQFQGRRRRQR
jgi:hypothetical protein